MDEDYFLLYCDTVMYYVYEERQDCWQYTGIESAERFESILDAVKMKNYCEQKKGFPPLTIHKVRHSMEVKKFQDFYNSIPLDEIQKQISGLPEKEADAKNQSLIEEHITKYNTSLAKPSSSRKGKSPQRGEKQKNAYVFRVALADDSEVYSDILIREDQTFEDLHAVIFEAFNREDEHLYCFDVGGTRIFSHDYGVEDDELDAAKTKLKNMDFEVGDGFDYLFDFGDEWWHDIELLEITPVESDVEYPLILSTHGEIPAQYENDEEEYNPYKPPEVFHPELLKIIAEKCSQWDGNPDCIFIEECDNIPAGKDVKNFVRGKIVVSVRGEKSDTIPVEFRSLKELFRKDKYPDIDCCFRYHMENMVYGLTDHNIIRRGSNKNFTEIFSSMAKEPDTPSLSFLHDMIWTSAAIFLLKHECSRKTFIKTLRELIESIKKNTGLTFYDFCLECFQYDDEG